MLHDWSCVGHYFSGGQTMRSFTCILTVLCLSAGMAYAGDQPKLSPAEQEVVNVSKARIDAASRRDIAALARYFAEDCILSTDDGTVITKAELMEHYKKPTAAYDRLVDPRDHIAHVYGNTAVVNYRVSGHEQFGDTDLISEQRRTETWLKRNGSWLLIAMQWDNMPVNLHTPVPVDTSVYKGYVGQYQWRPLDDVETISVTDGKLWSRFPKDEDEYLPLSSDTFFVKDDLGSVTFVRDAQGHVTGYTYHRFDGQEIHVKKIK
jgi:ketosteroid isomerase-like protein